MAVGTVCCRTRLLLLLLLITNLSIGPVAAAEVKGSLEKKATLEGPSNDCWDLVIVIPSHITEFSRRCAVRDGWARQLRGHEQNNRGGLRSIKLLFTVGAHYPDNYTRDTAMAEMKQFDDIITLPADFVDHYDALGTKVRLSFKEVIDRVGKFRLVLKADTDSYVHVEKLLNFFDKENMWEGGPVYAGSFRHAPVMWEPENKDHKWFDAKFTQMTGLTQYPWNAQGGGYVISYQLAKYLAHPPLQLKSWTHEDVGVGAWLMALDYRRIDMPVGFSAPECGCALECVDSINDLGGRDLVIDHYVPPFLHRIRQRRMEIFGDDCWTPSDASSAIDRVIPVNSKCYKPMWLGGEDLQNEYGLTPLQLSPDSHMPPGFKDHSHRRLEDHSETRSGVCGIHFDWQPSPTDERCMVCRGSDGYDYDEFECGDPTSVVKAAASAAVESFNESDRVDGNSLLPSLFYPPKQHWIAVEDDIECSARAVVMRRGEVTLADCKYLAWSGHYSILKWVQQEALDRLPLSQKGMCYVYNQYECHARRRRRQQQEEEEGVGELYFLPTVMEAFPPSPESSGKDGMKASRVALSSVAFARYVIRIIIFSLIVLAIAKIFFAVRNRRHQYYHCCPHSGVGRSSSRSRSDSFTRPNRRVPQSSSRRFALVRKLMCKLFRDYHPVTTGFAV